LSIRNFPDFIAALISPSVMSMTGLPAVGNSSELKCQVNKKQKSIQNHLGQFGPKFDTVEDFGRAVTLQVPQNLNPDFWLLTPACQPSLSVV
jgi:hypothetical protein